MTTATLIQVGIYLATLAGGYLLRHYGVNIPGLPNPTSAPSAPSTTPTGTGVDHVGLLQQVLAVGKTEAEALLQQAVRAIIAKALADAHAAASVPTPTLPAATSVTAKS